MNVARLRTVARVVGVMVFALLGLLLLSMHRTYSSLAQKKQGGAPVGAGASRSGSRRVMLAAGSGPERALERLLGRGYTVHFRQDFTGDRSPEIVASGGLEGAEEGAVLERALVLTRQDPGWAALFDSADPRFWKLGEREQKEVNRQLGLRPDEDPAPVLALQGHYRLDSVAPERVVLEPVTPRGRGLGPVVAFEWDRRHGAFVPRLLGSDE